MGNLSFFQKLSEKLSGTKENLTKRLRYVFKGGLTNAESFIEEAEEILITADFGLPTTEKIVAELEKRIREEHAASAEDYERIVRSILKEILKSVSPDYSFENEPSLILLMGVNGVGKTTTAAKLAERLMRNRKSVLLAACDTFRAAADLQLSVWSERTGVPIVHGRENEDPSAVLFDAISAASKRNTDVLICDTAGRMHNQKNLMDELSKMNRIAEKECPARKVFRFLVIDGTTGQNALSQVKEFSGATTLSGIIVTKLDGTGKGGMIFPILSEFKLPVLYIGVGETAEDFEKFSADDYVDALFTEKE